MIHLYDSSTIDSGLSDISEIVGLWLMVCSLLGDDLTEFHVEASIKDKLVMVVRECRRNSVS